MHLGIPSRWLVHDDKGQWRTSWRRNQEVTPSLYVTKEVSDDEEEEERIKADVQEENHDEGEYEEEDDQGI